nr:hypothetical protein [Micromonospora sp. DSM 115978]
APATPALDPRRFVGRVRCGEETDIHLYRTSHAYHGVHPFYMWYWATHGMDHLGDVVWVGGDRRACSRLGFRAASTLADALEMVSGTVGRDPSVTYLHSPPHAIADVR